MRLLLPCHTGSHALTRDEVVAALTPLGWLASDDNQRFIEAKTKEILDKLPGAVQDELSDTHPVLIEGQAGTWGLCSLEKKNTVTFRVLHPDAGELQAVAQRVVDAFAPALEVVIAGPVSFPESIQIRKIDNQEVVGSGVIQRRPGLSVFEYVRTFRQRERRILNALAALFLTCAVASLALFAFAGQEGGPGYVGGWLDRLGSAFLVAILTTGLTLAFDYRGWRSRGDSIAWTFGEVHYAPPD